MANSGAGVPNSLVYEQTIKGGSCSHLVASA